MATATNKLLNLKLTLDRSECVRGESVFFKLTLENVSGRPIQGVRSFDPEFPAVKIFVEANGKRQSADQQSHQERSGYHDHGPDTDPPLLPLGPAQSVSLEDDLLMWFGELEPGTYDVFAQHQSEAMSNRVKLRVAALDPKYLSTPRYSSLHAFPALSGAMVHKAADGRQFLFYQRQDVMLPSNPMHSIRLVESPSPDPISAHAAMAPSEGASAGHLVWQDQSGRIFFASANVAANKPAAQIPVQHPFKAQLLASPLTADDGQLWIPVADESAARVQILKVAPDGNAQGFDLPIPAGKTLGPHSIFWEGDQKLHIAWAPPRGRDVQYSRLILADPDAGFSNRPAFMGDDPVVWIDVYRDSDSNLKHTPYFVQTTPPDQTAPKPAPPPFITLWCVVDSAAGFTCHRYNTHNTAAEWGANLVKPEGKKLRVVASAVNYRHHLSLLFADEMGRIYFGSTERRLIAPLAEIIGKELTAPQCPGLLPAGRNGIRPWVFLRYIDQQAKRIIYRKLEPAAEAEPHYGHHH